MSMFNVCTFGKENYETQIPVPVVNLGYASDAFVSVILFGNFKGLVILMNYYLQITFSFQLLERNGQRLYIELGSNAKASLTKFSYNSISLNVPDLVGSLTKTTLVGRFVHAAAPSSCLLGTKR